MSTIVDVARRAGVSPMTVSRYFNQPGLLRAATRERVQRAVEALRYVPNRAARSLVQGRTHLVALVVADVTNPFFTTISRGVEDAAQESGYTLMIGNADETLEKERAYLDVLIAQRADGIALAPALGEEHNLEVLQHRRLPFVLIDRKVEGVAADLVRGDTFDGGLRLVRHLVEQGYRDLAFVGGPPGVSSLEERLDGYRVGMQAAGLPARVYTGRYDAASGEAITEELIAAGALPEALVAANNFVAVGVLAALRRHGLRVPADVALACFDDLEVAALIDPFLTVVAQPAYEMGRQAMRLLLERIAGYDGPAREAVLPVELVVRRSSVRPGIKS